jgi:hypothetical protein
MESIIEWLKWAIATGPNFVTALVAVLTTLITLFMLVPGEQPEAFLRKVVDFLSRFSIKPKDDAKN